MAGAAPDAVEMLLDRSNPDIRARFTGIQPAWEAIRHTGYGEAVRLIARELYDIEEITPTALEAAQDKHQALLGPGQRRRILEEKANLDHVQIDDMTTPCFTDEAGPDFFFYDLSWFGFCSGTPDLAMVAQETGVEVGDLNTLDQGMTGLFERFAGTAIAIKAQHAYERTLRWQPRPAAEAAQAPGRLPARSRQR